MAEVRDMDLGRLLGEQVEVNAGVDVGTLGDWFKEEFVVELLKASMAALGEHMDRPAAEDLSLVLVRMFASGYVSGYYEALYPGEMGVYAIGNRDTG